MEKLPTPVQWLLALIGGGIVALACTPLNQATVVLGGVTIIWGVVVALLVTAAYLVSLRLLSATRWLAIFGAVGVIAGVLWMTLEGAGGGVLVPANLAGTIWAIGPSIVAVIAIAFPRLRAR